MQFFLFLSLQYPTETFFPPLPKLATFFPILFSLVFDS